MFRKLFKLAAILQLTTGVMHSLSFFVDPTPKNETESQLFYLMKNYHRDLGQGFKPTTEGLFLAMSICFTILCFFAGFLNLYVLRKSQDLSLLKGIVGINSLTFGFLFIAMTALTFLPPIVCTGLIFITFLISLFYARSN